jgi:hypothetical protein
LSDDYINQLPYGRAFYFENADHLIATARYWQRELRLEDWSVCYHIRKHFDMPSSKADGVSKVFSEQKIAYIYLMEPADHEWKESYDMEQVLVHELLHIPFDPWMDRSKEGPLWAAQEAFIDQMATTLVRLNRGERR